MYIYVYIAYYIEYTPSLHNRILISSSFFPYYGYPVPDSTGAAQDYRLPLVLAPPPLP